MKTERFDAMFVTFLIANETYAVPAKAVREVVRWTPVTRVPNASPAVKGVMNLRGEIVSVLDVRTSLGLPVVEPTDRTCIVVVTAQDADRRLHVGLIVDTALDVTHIAEPEQEHDALIAGEHVQGIARTKAGLIILLDVNRLALDALGLAAGAA